VRDSCSVRLWVRRDSAVEVEIPVAVEEGWRSWSRSVCWELVPRERSSEVVVVIVVVCGEGWMYGGDPAGAGSSRGITIRSSSVVVLAVAGGVRP